MPLTRLPEPPALPARRPRRVLLLVLLASLSCAVLPVPAASAATHRVVVTGTVRGAGTDPVRGALVVTRTDDSAGLLFGLASLGFGCLLLPVDPCGLLSATARTGATGAFRTSLDPADPRARTGRHTLLVSGPQARPEQRPVTSTTFQQAAGGAALPPVRLWSPTVERVDAGADRTFIVSPLPVSYGRDRSVSVDLVDARDRSAWHYGDTTTNDARVVETGTAGLRAVGTATPSGFGRTTYSGPRAAAGSAGTPASRGLGCSTYDTRGRLVALPSCPYTDGALGVQPGLAYLTDHGISACAFDSQCARPDSVVLDRRTVSLLSTVVVRGCSGSCPVEVSLDGSTWAPWPAVTRGSDGDLVLTGAPVPARWVRVSLGSFGLWDAREISLW